MYPNVFKTILGLMKVNLADQQWRRSQFACANMVLLLLLLLMLPTDAQAQYTYTTNNDGTIRISYYFGTSANVFIPGTINNRPVEIIGYYAFTGANLAMVTIPSSVTNIEDFAFAGCTNLTSILVDGHNSFYSSTNGVLFNKQKTTLIEFPGGLGGDYNIPRSVTNIWNNAFYECDQLISVTIPRSVIDIGFTPFSFCNKLTQITVDAHNPLYSSVNGVVFNKSQTTLVECPSGLVGYYSIPSSVTNIGDASFFSCGNLTNITIPESVTQISERAFEFCTRLTGMTIPNSVIDLGNTAFNGCDDLTSVWIGDRVVNIGGAAFFDCKKLTSIFVPANVTNIENSAFQGCASLTNIMVDAQNQYYSSLNGVLFDKSQTTLLEYPGGLRGSYTIPGSVTDIGDNAFNGCTKLTNLSIPDNVISVGGGAFAYCTGLTSVTIPNSVTSIGEALFLNCPALTNVTFPSGMTTIGYMMFGYCTSLTAITIPNSVTDISESTFYGCTNLTSVTFPAGVTNIGDSAFADCSSLGSVNFMSNAPPPNSDVFLYDAGTTVYYLPGTSGWGSVYDGRPAVLWNPPLPYNYAVIDGTISITGYFGSNATVIIPSTINFLPVTSIGASAFFGSILTNVTIPDTVTNIGDQAFFFSLNLAAVNFLGDAPSFGYQAFGTPNLVSSPPETYMIFPNCYYLPGTTGWGTNFGGCPAYLVIPPYIFTPANGTITINSYTGPGGQVTIPDTINGLPVVGIGNSAFAGSSLTSITIPSSVISMGYLVFEQCTTLTNVYFYGNAPSLATPLSFDWTLFRGDPQVNVYYLPGTMGWGSTFGGSIDNYNQPFGGGITAPWLLPEPVILDNNTNFGVQNGEFGFTISWATNNPVVVEACTSLGNPRWQPVQTNILTGGSSYFSDPEWTNYPSRFYRLSLK